MNNVTALKSGILLIGPENTGKSSVGEYLSGQLELPFYDLTREKNRYRKLTTFDPVRRSELYQTAGFEAVFRYMMPIRAQVVVRALQDFGAAVIKLGAFDSTYDDPDLLARVSQAFEPYAQVCLLRPSADIDESSLILEKRGQVYMRGLDWNEYFIRHPANRRLAKKVFYTKDHTPHETVAAIIAQIDRRSREVFLLGPVGTGKTTIGKALSAALNIPPISMDGIRRRYYAEIGYSQAEEQRIQQNQGFEAVLDYWNQFDLHATKRLLEEYPGRIVDFGAGQTVLEVENDFLALEALLAPYPNVFLLLPSPDVEEALAILRHRQRLRTSISGTPMIAFQLEHPANFKLRTMVVNTLGKSAKQIGQEIMRTTLKN